MIALDDRDRILLDGAQGPAMQLAMRLVLRAGEILGARSLVPISFAHIDACFYSGEAHVDWSGEPRITLDMELRPYGATVYFTLTLCRETAGVDVTYVAFDAPDEDPSRNTAYLREVLDRSRLRKQAAA